MKNISELPVWSFDGSCSYLAEGNNSDVYLHPVALYRDPFRSAAFWFLDLHRIMRMGRNNGTCLDTVESC